MVFGNFSLFKTPFPPGRSSVPPSFVSFLSFIFFPTSSRRLGLLFWVPLKVLRVYFECLVEFTSESVSLAGRLLSMGSHRVRHDCDFTFTFHFSCIEEGNGNPIQCSCLENPRDGRAWWAAVYGVAQSRTRLKCLSSSSSSLFGLLVVG